VLRICCRPSVSTQQQLVPAGNRGNAMLGHLLNIRCARSELRQHALMLIDVFANELLHNASAVWARYQTGWLTRRLWYQRTSARAQGAHN